MNAAQINTLVLALARLRTGAADEQALLEALARLIEPASGPAAKPRAHAVVADRAVRDTAGPDVGGRSPPGASPPAPPLPGPAGAPATARPRERAAGAEGPAAEPSVLEKVSDRADLVTPDRQAPRADAARAAAATDPGGPGAPLESLFAPGRVRGILREMTTLSRAGANPDIAAIVRLIARAQPVSTLPRLRVTALGHSVQWLFDAGPSMLPFARDKQQLAAAATRLLGRDRVRIADFIGHPLQAVRPQRQVQWGELHWPPRGSALVVVSDLGIGSRDSGLQAPLWQQFAQDCRRQRLRSVVLIPYEQARWPAVASAFDTALSWDLATGVQVLRRLRRLAAHA